MWLGLIQSFFIYGQLWLPNRSTTKAKNEEICKYVYMYIACTIVYNIKKKKRKKTTNSDLLPLGSLFLMGLNSILSSYSQSKSEKKGGRRPWTSGNRLVFADLVLWGRLTLGQNGPSQFCSFMSSCMSLAAYPPSKQ